MKKTNSELQLQIQRCICYGITALAVIACALIMYFCIERISGLRTFLQAVGNALMPVIIGIVIAYLVSPIFNFAHRHLHPRLTRVLPQKAANGWSTALSILISLLVLVLALYALVAMIVPQLIDSVVTIVNNVPTYILQIRQGLNILLEDYPDIRVVAIDAFNNATTYVQNWFSSHLDLETLFSDSLQEFLSNAWGAFTNIFAGVKNLVIFAKNVVIGLIIAVYLLAAKQNMLGNLKRLIYTILPRTGANILLENCRYAHHVLSGFIFGKILDSLIIGILCFVGCSILSIPYALLVSVIIGVTNIIPFFGPFIGAVPCAFFVLIVDPFRCLVFVILILVLQQFDGNILGPRILGNSTGLSSFWVIFSLLLFGGLMGFPGLVLGCPIWAVICHIVDEIGDYLLKRRGLSTDAADYELLGEIRDGVYVKIPDPSLPLDAEAAASPFRQPVTGFLSLLRKKKPDPPAPPAEDQPSAPTDEKE